MQELESAPQILFVTLGCAKNEVDTDRMRALLLAAGYEECFEVDEANVVLVNTCSFLAAATSESIEATLELVEMQQEGARELPIVMCGCVPSRYGDALPEELPEVSAFVRTDEEDAIVSVVDRVLGIERATSAPLDAGALLRTVQGTSAYVKISDGCDRYCSFCAIPFIRGRYHSRPLEEIVREVKALLAEGVREIVLIGQDTGIWGSDFEEPRTLADLLRELDVFVAPAKGWLRVLYLQPEGMTDELISAFKTLPSLLPYIDIPIQHTSAHVLKDMNRSGNLEELRALFAKLRHEIDGMVIRTTGLVGFPGETDEDFEELMAFIDEEAFDYVSVFTFSPEEGTRAARMPNQVDEEVALERTQQLMDLAESLGFAATASHVGQTVDVIIDGIDVDGDVPEFIGHAWFQAPDSDGCVHLAEGTYAVGDVVTVQLTDSFCYELEGVAVKED